MSKMNLFKTKEKKVLEAKDRDYLKLIQEFKKNEIENEDLKKEKIDICLV